MRCLKCGTDLDLMNTDSRQEWVDEYYICPMCDTQWIHKKTFKDGLVFRDEIYLQDEDLS
jgi:DNA-directed RNA polymerase subunit RPC12/RpoP